jgi:hypothetical protein
MSPREWISIMYVAAVVLSVSPLVMARRSSKREQQDSDGITPGTFADFNHQWNADRRAAEREAAPRRASLDVLLVGGGVAVGSVASILSLYLL